MDKIIRFIPKSELERARLIREARAIYDSIFPPMDGIGEQTDGRATQERQTKSAVIHRPLLGAIGKDTP
jgi:hypothetical protein